MSASVALRQRVQQCLRLLQVSGVKPLGEPVIDLCQQVMGFLAFALLAPKPSETCGSTEFPRLGLLALGYTDGVMEAGFGFSLIVRILLQQEFTPQAIVRIRTTKPPPASSGQRLASMCKPASACPTPVRPASMAAACTRIPVAVVCRVASPRCICVCPPLSGPGRHRPALPDHALPPRT